MELTSRQKEVLIDRWQILMSTNHSASGVSRQEGISRDTYYNIVNDYSDDGLPGLLDKSRAHRSHSLEKPEYIQNRIIELAVGNPKLGCRKIFRILCNDGVGITRQTVYNILKKNKLNTYFLRKQRHHEMLKMTWKAEEYY